MRPLRAIGEMDAAESLMRRAHEYEVLAASYDERASIQAGNGITAVSFVVVAIVLREVAAALEWADEEAA